MPKPRPTKTIVPAGFFPKLMLPFAGPILFTLLLVVLVSEHIPRTLAPGSGLKLTGLFSTAIAGVMAWRWAVNGIADKRAHTFGAIFCTVTALLGWPVWTMGILPTVNGLSLSRAETIRMRLERTEVTTVSRSRSLNHWAWLVADVPGSPAGSGRYFIPETVHTEWSKRQGGPVTISIATGLLGAAVVTGYR